MSVKIHLRYPRVNDLLCFSTTGTEWIVNPWIANMVIKVLKVLSDGDIILEEIKLIQKAK